MLMKKGFELQVRPRSGTSFKTGLRVTNTPGTVDSGYRGEVGVIVQLVPFGDSDDYIIKEHAIKKGDRIAQGVKSGQLTPKETVNLEKKEAAIHKEVRTERKANGGTLTPAEKKQVNSQQNKVSKQIDNKKHNDKKQ